MQNVFRMLVGLFVTLVFIISTLTGVAQPPEPVGKWWKDPSTVKRLELTPEQIQQIEGIWVEHKKRLLDLKVELDKQNEALQELLSKDSVDENILQDQIHRVVQARATLREANWIRLSMVRKILTPKQRAILKQLSKQKPEPQKSKIPPK